MEGLLEALRTHHRLAVRSAEPVTGGLDVWATSWRAETDQGPLLVRADRSAPLRVTKWIKDVLRLAADAGVPCHPPLSTVDGDVAFVIADATVTARPFIDGHRLDRDEPTQVRAAGSMLGLLHTALSGIHRDRPETSRWDGRLWSSEHDPPILRDPELDRWHALFTQSEHPSGVIHGDFSAGNVLWAAGAIAAVIDWWEARADILARELAWSTWEFGHSEPSHELDIDRARTFLAGYRAVTGPWEPDLAEALIPLMRLELRRNARYTLGDPGKIEYSTALHREFASSRVRV